MTQFDADLSPLEFAADEVSRFDTSVTQAAAMGVRLARTAHGYRLDVPGVTLHFLDLADVVLLLTKGAGHE